MGLMPSNIEQPSGKTNGTFEHTKFITKMMQLGF